VQRQRSAEAILFVAARQNERENNKPGKILSPKAGYLQYSNN